YDLSGLHSIVWGDTRENLLAAKVLLDDANLVEFSDLSEAEFFSKLALKTREGEIYRDINGILTDKSNRDAILAGYPKSEITRRKLGYALDMLLDHSQPFNFCRDRKSTRLNSSH